MNVQHRWPGESRFLGWLYILPGLLIYLVFIFYPILETIRTSFYQWDGFSSSRTFIGADNYVSLVADSNFLNALVNNLIFIIFYSVIPIFIGLALASLLGRKPLPGMTFFRTGLFLPQILSMVVVGVTWRWIFNPTFGPLNMGLRALGLDSLTRAWLGDFTWRCPRLARWVHGFNMAFAWFYSSPECSASPRIIMKRLNWMEQTRFNNYSTSLCPACGLRWVWRSSLPSSQPCAFLTWCT